MRFNISCDQCEFKCTYVCRMPPISAKNIKCAFGGLNANFKNVVTQFDNTGKENSAQFYCNYCKICKTTCYVKVTISGKRSDVYLYCPRNRHISGNKIVSEGNLPRETNWLADFTKRSSHIQQ